MKKQLVRSKTNKKILGVCGGIAEYFNIDATLVRLIVTALAVITPFIGDGVVLYLITALILPNCDSSNNEV